MASSWLLNNLFLPLLLQIVLLKIGPTYAQTVTSHNINLGSSLAALAGRTTAWPSPSGDFAFGFRPLEADGNRFLLAIWFDGIEDKTVVWCAHGNQTVQAGAAVELNTEGQLSLQDHDGKEVWNVKVNTTVAYAAMLDNGNFILASSSGSVEWQSFDYPSDTILPSQVLGVGKELQSRLMDANYSSGRFKLSIQSDGNLTFYPVNILTGYKYYPYWATNTSGNGSQLVFNESTGTIYLALNNSHVNFLSERTYSMNDFYQRATLDFDGVFRQYIHPKNTKKGARWTAVGFQPPDICRNLTNTMGSGACGYNSYCVSGGGNQTVECKCPPSYSFLDPNRKHEGCHPNFAVQNCMGKFTLIEMINVDWPLTAYEHMSPIDEDRCKRDCLSDCNCAVAIYQHDGQNCWKKRHPLSNGRNGTYVDRTAFIKVPIDSTKRYADSTKGGFGKKIVITTTLVPILLLLLCLGAFLWKKNRKKVLTLGIPITSSSKESIGIKLELHSLGIPNTSSSKVSKGMELEFHLFDLFTIESATGNFSTNNKLGEGGFGPVYKGQLEDGQEIAVKRLSKNSMQGVDEFKNEVMLIARLQHKNLIRTLGYCIQGEEKMLIYEYMQNKSLDAFIFGTYIILLSFALLVLQGSLHMKLNEL